MAAVRPIVLHVQTDDRPEELLRRRLVLTVDEVATIMRFEGDKRMRRRQVYDLVRDGVLDPIGGRPTGKLTCALRFTAAKVARLLDVEVPA